MKAAAAQTPGEMLVVRNDRERGANPPEDQAARGECAGALAQAQSRTSNPGLDVWLEVTWQKSPCSPCVRLGHKPARRWTTAATHQVLGHLVVNGLYVWSKIEV